MTLSEYLAVPENYRGVWTTERWDIPDWENLRKKHMGKRTLMVYDRGTCLLIEGLSLEIVDDSSWKKPEEIKKEIREKYQEYRTEKGHEPHFLECIIRWNDTLETLETRIALDMDSDTEMDVWTYQMSNSIVNINVHNHSNNTVISHASLDKSLQRS